MSKNKSEQKLANQIKRRARHQLKKKLAADHLHLKLQSIGDEALLDEYEAAAFVGKSVQWMRNRRVKGASLPFIKVGAAVRYRVADIKATFQRLEQTVKAGGAA